ncbi:MAG TPA: hypothetical protein VGE72_22390 [Azospirillum sp.]
MKQGSSQPHTVCCHCGQPVVAGQPRWAGDPDDRAWHYDCAEKADLVVPHRTWVRQPRSA